MPETLFTKKRCLLRPLKRDKIMTSDNGLLRRKESEEPGVTMIQDMIHLRLITPRNPRINKLLVEIMPQERKTARPNGETGYVSRHASQKLSGITLHARHVFANNVFKYGYLHRSDSGYVKIGLTPETSK